MYKERTHLFQQFGQKLGQIAVLVDPEKNNDHQYLHELVKKATFAGVNFFFIGGSTVSHAEFDLCVSHIKQISQIPVVIFPGAAHQVSDKADAILFLNLISGRNPDYLIGHQVLAAPDLHKMSLEIIPTAYILIDGGKKTSVQYVSQTTPIPREQHQIALNTAIAGKMMGNAVLYFDAGSGALQTVDPQMIELIKSETKSPIVVGGGIRTIDEISQFKNAGANIVVIGNHIEENIDFLLDVKSYLNDEQKHFRQ
jgi:putative glycerol-1-phosphate prenyltransferase